MAEKFIPNGDVAFDMMAYHFAQHIAQEPGRFAVSREDSDALSAAVAAYRAALQAARAPGTRSQGATYAKEQARAEAERHIRRLANLIRHNDAVDAQAKFALKLRERPAKATPQTLPDEPPRLKFVRALHEGNGAAPVHELVFYEFHSFSKSKPPGAARIELFVDLIPPDEPIPAHPGANHGGRPWYLRSYTRNPIVLAPPMARVPMRVVYWARWADSMGNVGPFSATAAAWIEGGSHHMLPGGMGMGRPGQPQPQLINDATPVGPAGRERKYFVALVEAQYESMNARHVESSPALPAPAQGERREPRQLEGPAAEEAA